MYTYHIMDICMYIHSTLYIPVIYTMTIDYYTVIKLLSHYI